MATEETNKTEEKEEEKSFEDIEAETNENFNNTIGEIMSEVLYGE